VWLVHFDGALWSEIPAPNLDCCGGIWGASATQLWASGSDPDDLIHDDGTGWSAQAAPPLDLGYGSDWVTHTGLWGLAGDDIWIVGEDRYRARSWHYDGSAWTEVRSPQGAGGTAHALHAVWGDASGFWAVGELGTIVHHPAQ
jgi:hypothetical protein